jgi:hypothetical protein
MSSTLLTVAEVIGKNGQVDPQLRADYMYGIRPPVETWGDGARRAVYRIVDHSFKWYDRVSDVRESLNNMIELSDSGKDVTPEVWAEYWTLLGSVAAATAAKMQVFETDLQNVEFYVEKISSVLVSKQLDYGSENISKFGRTGILVRAHDKVARIENLTKKGEISPKNESIADSFLDLIGYSAIGIMWEEEWFLLPIESN